MMLDFVYRLNATIPAWPDGSRKSLAEIAEATETSIPHVLQFLTEGLDREVELTSYLNPEEATTVIENLTKKLHPQIEARQREVKRKQESAIKAYDRLMGKIRVQLVSGGWHSAFRSLSYFAGQYEDELPPELVVTICSDVVRMGIKASITVQEVGRWLEKAVYCCMCQKNRVGIEEALDLIDAYGEHFLHEESGKGALLIGNMLGALEEPAARFELWTEFKDLIDQLYPMPAE